MDFYSIHSSIYRKSLNVKLNSKIFKNCVRISSIFPESLPWQMVQETKKKNKRERETKKNLKKNSVFPPSRKERKKNTWVRG